MLSWNIFRLFEKYLYNPKTIPSGNVLQFAVETIARLLTITMVIYLFKLVIFQFTTLNYQKIERIEIWNWNKRMYTKKHKNVGWRLLLLELDFYCFFGGALISKYSLQIHMYIYIYQMYNIDIHIYIYIYI